MKLPIILLCGNAGVGKDTVGQMIVDQRGFRKFAQADTIKHIAKDAFGFSDEQLWGPSEFRNALDFDFAPRAAKYQNFFKLQGPGAWGADAIFAAFVKRCEIQQQTAAQYATLWALVVNYVKALHAFADSKGGLTPRIVLQLLGTEVGRAYQQNIWVDRAIGQAEAAILGAAPGAVITDGRFRNEIIGFRKYGGYAVKIVGDTTLLADPHPSEKEIAGIPNHFYDAILYNDKGLGLDGLQNAVKVLVDQMLTPRSFCPFR